MDFEEWMELVVKAFEFAGVIILVVGSVAALASAVIALLRGRRDGVYKRARTVGRRPPRTVGPRT